MSKSAYLKSLFSTNDSAETPSSKINLLKKVVLLFQQGQLKVNDQYPDKAFTLTDYILDERRVMFDLNLLSDSHRELLIHWLLREHQVCLKEKWFKPYGISEEKGYPEEKTKGYLRTVIEGFLGNYTNYRCLLPFNKKTSSFELSHIDFSFSVTGILVDLVPTKGSKSSTELPVSKDYCDDGYLQNVKRVTLTDDVIGLLLDERVEKLDLTSSFDIAHSQAIEVLSPQVRNQRILDHRINRQYDRNTSFFWRIIFLIKRLYIELTSPNKSSKIISEYKPFSKTEGLELSLCSNTGKILAFEKRKEIDSLVLCGGGARIFSYLGVIEVLQEYGITPKKFSGSSAGAIMASFLYLGYDLCELKEKFQWINDNLLLDYKIDSLGLSTTDKMKDALQYFIFQRVQHEIKKHAKWFTSKEACLFLKTHVYGGHITFCTISKLKLMCPALNFGDELLITATNKTLRKTELLSTLTTPNMEIAEAVKLSASMPVIYKPTKIGPYVYTDGGVLKNLPISYFKQDKHHFISHELGGSLTLLALQFNGGVEENVAYSNKPIKRESWLINKFYHFLIGISDPVGGWMDDRYTLRNFSHQTILIDVKNLKATKFDLENKDRDELIASGQVAAKKYMVTRHHQKGEAIVNDEYLSTTFENLEALLIYCGNHKKWSVLENVLLQIQEDSSINEAYKQKLLRVGDLLMMIKAQESGAAKASQTHWRQLLPALQGVNLMKMGAKKEQKDKSLLFNILFPILSQKWLTLLDEKSDYDAYQDLKVIENHRKKLNINDEALVFNSLVDKMEGNYNNPTHLFYYILKTLLIYGRNEDQLDHIQNDLMGFIKVFSLLNRSSQLNVKKLIANWDFDVLKCKCLLVNLKEGNFEMLCKNLGRYYRPHYDLREVENEEHHLRELSISM